MKKAERIMGLIALIITALGTMITGEEYRKTQGESGCEKSVVVIDAGHGGKDPGKVGCHNEMEKDINLAIALRVRELLIEQGIEVVMTREGDYTATGDYDSTKNEDMKKRVDIINNAAAACCVSIHQNSYTSSGVRGAQTFFYAGSENAGLLAAAVQQSLVQLADPENTRKIKENKDYYVLVQSNCPTVIVECGFLSDEDESVKLNSPEYQDLLAGAIVAGILKYLKIQP